jgi:hypothetical protein
MSETTTMPGGTYWVGDPCYGVPDEYWMQWLEAADYTHNRILQAEVLGRQVLGIGTAHGDGCYFDQNGDDYPVDAGLIGLVPASLCQTPPFGMKLHVFSGPITCGYEEDGGVIVLGDLRIVTDPDEEPFGEY